MLFASLHCCLKTVTRSWVQIEPPPFCFMRTFSVSVRQWVKNGSEIITAFVSAFSRQPSRPCLSTRSGWTGCRGRTTRTRRSSTTSASSWWRASFRSSSSRSSTSEAGTSTWLETLLAKKSDRFFVLCRRRRRRRRRRRWKKISYLKTKLTVFQKTGELVANNSREVQPWSFCPKIYLNKCSTVRWRPLNKS